MSDERDETGRFKKGKVGGPGRKKLIPELPNVKNALRKRFDKKALTEAVDKYMFIPFPELKRVVENKSESIDAWVATVIYNGIVKGDVVRFEWICSRTIGKVTEKMEVALPQATIIERIGGGEYELGATIVETENESE